MKKLTFLSRWKGLGCGITILDPNLTSPKSFESDWIPIHSTTKRKRRIPDTSPEIWLPDNGV
jgi:hypothetical protein